MMQRLMILIAITALFGVCAHAQIDPPPNAPMYFPGLIAPDFTAANSHGKSVSLSEFSGYGSGFVVLDSAAVWCGPCNNEAQSGIVSAATGALTDNFATQYLAYKGLGGTVGISSSIVQLLIDGPAAGIAANAGDAANWVKHWALPFTVLYPSTPTDYRRANYQLYFYGNAWYATGRQSGWGGFFPLKVVIGPDMKILGYPGADQDPNTATIDSEDAEITTIIQNSFDTNDTYKLYDLIAFTAASGVPISPGDHTFGSTVGHPLKDALGDLQDIQKTDGYTTQLARSQKFCQHMDTFLNGLETGPASAVLDSNQVTALSVRGKAIDVQVDMGCIAPPFTYTPPNPPTGRRPALAKPPQK